MTDAKVLHLSKLAPERLADGRLPASLSQVRDKAAPRLRQALQALFGEVDDSLFEMADRATSNAEQNAFFEAMRDLRLQRGSIERGFQQTLFDGFSRLAQYEIGKPPPLDAVSFDSLTLVQNDELEERVAIDAMVARVIGREGAALAQLSERINVLARSRVDDKHNPLGPLALCEAFGKACAGLGVEIRVKLLLFKLFERHVLGALGALYDEANQSLVEAGVLPELSSVPAHRRVPSSAPSGDAELPPFDGLQELLAHVRQVAPRERPADAVPITSQDLTRLLSHLQQVRGDGDAGLRERLEQMLGRASLKSGRTRVVGAVDEDVINLVSMLFEFILDDGNLSDALKALIGRLQIPMLKVAVLDKTFFNRGSHPARRLLNEIASAALSWSDRGDERRDSLYLKIEQVVQRLLNDFVDDPAIFAELLADFLAFTGDQRRRSELLEQRTRDAAEGSARAEEARLQVEQALNERLLGRTLPEVVVSLLRDGWSRVLTLTCLKHGGDSAEWQAAVATMDELIWSVEPIEDGQARQRLLDLLPGLLRDLREGLAEVAFDPFRSGEFFARLEPLHVQGLQRFQCEAPVEERPPALPEVVEEAEVPVMVEVLEEIVLASPEETPALAPEEILAEDDDALRQVDNLRVGSWVEFQDDEEHRLRCKLAAVVRLSGKYVFVNRTGMKVLEKTRMGLAVEFRRGSIRLLDDAQLFDRALESVIGNLRRLRNT